MYVWGTGGGRGKGYTVVVLGRIEGDRLASHSSLEEKM